MQPIPFDDFLASQEMRDEAWRRRFAMEEQFGGARPGRGHRALASLYRAGKVARRDHAEHRQSAPGLGHCGRTRGRVARQHHLCDLPRLRKRYELPWVKQQFDAAGGRAPDCPTAAATSRPRRSRSARRCPKHAMRRAEELDARLRSFLAIGSSLVVWPAAGFPLMAKRNGARLVIINREPTEFDDIADLVVRDDIGDGARSPSSRTDSINFAGALFAGNTPTDVHRRVHDPLISLSSGQSSVIFDTRD